MANFFDRRPSEEGVAVLEEQFSSRQRPSVFLIDERMLERDCLEYRMDVLGFHVRAMSSIREFDFSEATPPESVIVWYFKSFQKSDLDAIAAFQSKSHDRPIVVMSPTETFAEVMAALKIGVSGYIPTSMPIVHVAAAIRLVLAGGVYVPISSLIAAPPLDMSIVLPDQMQGEFTAKQVSVIEGIRRGKANKTIAYELNMCESTVKVHIRNIMKKLNVRNRTELALKASSFLLASGDSLQSSRG